MGESRKEALKLGFDGSVRLEFRGATVSSDGGLLAYRDVDEVFALTAIWKVAEKSAQNAQIQPQTRILRILRGRRTQSNLTRPPILPTNWCCYRVARTACGRPLRQSRLHSRTWGVPQSCGLNPLVRSTDGASRRSCARSVPSSGSGHPRPHSAPAIKAGQSRERSVPSCVST